MHGLGPNVNPDYMTKPYLKNLAPFLLGMPVWNAVEHRNPNDWVELTLIVEKQFGLTHKQILDAFFSMYTVPREASHTFVLHIE